MSEPIQSIAQNNYILATQQEVSHDNTLSGNGTVDSPLGVVPGYNETVLWSGLLNTNNATANLSESITHFKYVQVEGYTHNGVEFPWVTKLPVNGNNAIYGIGLNQWKVITKELDMNRFKVEDSVITCMEATWIIPSNNWGNTTSNITKVIGIGRISANS